MRAGYTIFPHSGYILEKFRGAVTYQDLMRLTARQQRDRRILPSYHTLSDYTQSTLCLTEIEARQYCDAVYTSPAARTGRRAVTILGARNLAFANLIESFANQFGLLAKCFHHRDAALNWLSECPIEASNGRLNVHGRRTGHPFGENTGNGLRLMPNV